MSPCPLRVAHLILVVGPSGAGKDTLIDYARAQLRSDPSFHFARRVITRPPSVGEDHESVDIEEFQRRAGAFALHWQAHGLFYGIPATVEDQLDCGAVVIANGSRAIGPSALCATTCRQCHCTRCGLVQALGGDADGKVNLC